MDKNPIGRPIKEDAIIRTGRRLLLWLSLKDMERLNQLAKTLANSKADTIRKLIREFSLEE
jgi:hypothetical protein